MLSDFGLSIFIGDSGGKTSGKCGTAGYFSPEVADGVTEYSVDADWWGLGCVIYELVTKFNPFDPRITGMSTREEGTKKMTLVKFNEDFPPEVKPLVRHLLNRNVKERCGCMGGDYEEIFKSQQFWSGWDLSQEDFRVNLDQLPVAPLIPEDEINAFAQEKVELEIPEYNGTTDLSKKLDINFQPFVNVEEYQRDIIKVLEKNANEKRVPKKTNLDDVAEEEDLLDGAQSRPRTRAGRNTGARARSSARPESEMPSAAKSNNCSIM